MCQPTIHPNVANILFEDPTQEGILIALKEQNSKQIELAQIQSDTANKQFKNTRNLSVLAIIFAFIAIIPIIRDIYQPKKSEIDVIELMNQYVKQSKINEDMLKIFKYLDYKLEIYERKNEELILKIDSLNTQLK